MIVVLANELDQGATRIVRRWADRGAVRMAPADLSRAGWCCISRDPSRSECVIGGMSRHSREIEGVLIRLSAVAESDLPHIAPSDRGYVAAEMNAFLVHWLTTLNRPILNRPTPRSLCGPGWYPEHWMHYAASVGLSVKAMKRSIKLRSVEGPSWPEHEGPRVELTIVGGECFGDASSALVKKALALTALAETALAKICFDSPCSNATFLAADPCPPLDDERVEKAVLGYFEKRERYVAARLG